MLKTRNKNSADRRLPWTTTQTSQPGPATEPEVIFTSQSRYKKITNSNRCYCGTCVVLGQDVINKFYSAEHLIPENSDLILSLWGRDLVKN